MKLAIAVLMMATALFVAPAYAADSATISVTVSLEFISVSLDTAAWNIGPISLGGSNTLPTVTATNEGNVDIDVKIQGTDGAGGWTLGTSGADSFEVEETNTSTTLSTTAQALTTGLAPSATLDIDLTYTAPTSDTLGGAVDQSFDITVTASKTP